MNKKLLIDRFLSWPLPESLCSDPCASMPGYPHRTGTNLMTAEHAAAMIEHVIAAPRQSEGDAISRERVQAEADAFFDWPTADKSSVTTTSCLIFARCIAGMVAAERDATIAELREVNRIQLEIAEVHGAACVEIRKERNTLRQQLAERDAEIMEQCRLDGMGAERELKLMAQRDKLARLLADVKADYTHAIHWGDLHATMKRIDAALAEVSK